MSLISCRTEYTCPSDRDAAGAVNAFSEIQPGKQEALRRLAVRPVVVEGDAGLHLRSRDDFRPFVEQQAALRRGLVERSRKDGGVEQAIERGAVPVGLVEVRPRRRLDADRLLAARIISGFGIVTSMDKMVGPDFEKGLRQLKDVAERPGP